MIEGRLCTIVDVKKRPGVEFVRVAEYRDDYATRYYTLALEPEVQQTLRTTPISEGYSDEMELLLEYQMRGGYLESQRLDDGTWFPAVFIAQEYDYWGKGFHYERGKLIGKVDVDDPRLKPIVPRRPFAPKPMT